MSDRTDSPGQESLDAVRAAERSANDLIDLGRTQADLIVAAGRHEAETARERQLEPARELQRRLRALAADVQEELAPRRAAIEAHLDRLEELTPLADGQVRALAPRRPRPQGDVGAALVLPAAAAHRADAASAGRSGSPRLPVGMLATVAYWLAVALVSVALVIGLILFLEARDVSSLGQ